MSVNISSGGGGGGITIETDPTALKLTGGTLTGGLTIQANGTIAFANINPDIDYPSITIQDSGGNWMQYSSSGITFPDGTTLSTASGGGGSFNGGTITTPLIADDGISGQAIVDPNFEGTARLFVGSYDNNLRTIINPSGISLYNNGVSLGINEAGITFPDNTVQTTAYTGGGGGGSITNEQRLADAIAGSFGYIQYYLFDVGYGFSIGWTWAGSSTGYTYPSVVDRANWYGCGISVNGNLYPLQYADTYGFYTVENLTSGYQSGEFFVYVNNAISEPQLSMPFGSNV